MEWDPSNGVGSIHGIISMAEFLEHVWALNDVHRISVRSHLAGPVRAMTRLEGRVLVAVDVGRITGKERSPAPVESLAVLVPRFSAWGEDTIFEVGLNQHQIVHEKNAIVASVVPEGRSPPCHAV
jgi:hypothetical protein